MKECICGSGLSRRELRDARGIFVSFVCDKCEEQVRSKYRREIFDDRHYEVSEPVYEEWGF